MPLVSALTKSLQVKIVYYGPGLSGKTTNLEKLAVMLDKDRVGELMSLDTSGDRTLFFDWMPVDLGKIRGFDVKIQLYTVPGQIRYDRTRQQVLRGVDGIVFVADSQRDAMEQNVFSFKNLRDNLALSGRDLEEIPLVIQCNKKDLPNTVTTREMAIALHAEHLPFIEASAQTGQGVLETLRLITRLTMKHVQAYLDPTQAKNLPSSQEALDGDALLSKMLTSEAILKEHEEAEKSAAAPAPADSGMRPVAGGHVPAPEEVDRADSAELTPVVEIKEELLSPRAPAAVEIEAEPSDEPPEPSPTLSGEADVPAAPEEPRTPEEPPAAPAAFAMPAPDASGEPASETPPSSGNVEPAPDAVPAPVAAGEPGAVEAAAPVPVDDARLAERIREAVRTETASLQESVREAGRAQTAGFENAARENAELRRVIQEQEKRIHELEMLVTRNTLAIQNLSDMLSALRRGLAETLRGLDNPNP